MAKVEFIRRNTDIELNEVPTKDGQILTSKEGTLYADYGNERKMLGVPAGGTTGQVLAKKTNSDNDTEWIDPPQGTGGGSIVIERWEADE